MTFVLEILFPVNYNDITVCFFFLSYVSIIYNSFVGKRIRGM